MSLPTRSVWLVQRILHSYRGWTSLAVAVSVLVCGTVTWMHFRQRTVVTRTRQLVESFRRARVDLANGFLHVSLADGADSPFDRNQGLALLNQALAELRTDVASNKSDSLIGTQKAVVQRDFEKASASLQQQLAEMRPGPVPPAVETVLRLAFHELDRQAEVLDGLNQGELRELARQFDQRFVGVLSAAVILLTAICIGVFVSGRRQSGYIAALQESERRFRKLAESLPQMVWTCATGGAVEYVSRKWLEFTGLPEAQLLGDGWSGQLHPDDREASLTAWTRAVRDGTALQSEWRIRRHDGSYRWFDTRVVPMRDSRGEIMKWVGSHADITERKQAAERLQAQLIRTDLLNQIARSIADRQSIESTCQVVVDNVEQNLPVDFCGVLVHDEAAACLKALACGARCDDLSSEMLTAGPQRKIPIDPNGLSRCMLGALVYEPDLAAVPTAFSRRLKERGLSSLVLSPLIVEEKVFGILAAARRETDSFSSPDCEFLRQLGEHVALAVHQIHLHDALQRAYDDLRQTQQVMLEQERLRALGQMASGIAHDINNAISPILLYSELLQKKEQSLSGESREALQIIQRSVEDVAHTIARLREFYRGREPRTELQPVFLNRLIQEVLILTRVRWKDMPQERGIVIDVRTELAQDLPEIHGIESEIREALTNLVFNAVDAMPSGGTLTLKTGVIQPDPDPRKVSPRHAFLTVSDTGVGMDEATRQRCFEPFFTTKGERGTGLGLAMVLGIAERHEATVEIESALGTGTTIRLRFPPPQTPAVAASPSQQPHEVPPLRILVVDDDPLIVKAVTIGLQLSRHRVSAADGGQAGIDAFTAALAGTEPFDLVITDLGMPRVDGRMVAEAVKAASPRIPVILLTGWGQRLLDDGAIPPQVDRVVAKPPKLAALHEAIVACFESRLAT